jgi:hypothetical protein
VIPALLLAVALSAPRIEILVRRPDGTMAVPEKLGGGNFAGPGAPPYEGERYREPLRAVRGDRGALPYGFGFGGPWRGSGRGHGGFQGPPQLERHRGHPSSRGLRR